MTKQYKLTSNQAISVLPTLLLPAKFRDMQNIGIYFSVKNAKIDYLEKAFNRLIEDNDALRLRCRFTIKGMIQYITDFDYYKMPIVNIDSENELLNKMKQEKIIPGAYKGEVLYKAIIYICNDKAYLFMCFHHLCFDGFSINLTYERIKKYYESYVNGELVDLKPKYCFEDYIKEDLNYKHSEKFISDKEYVKHIVSRKKGFGFICPNVLPSISKNIIVRIEGDTYNKCLNFCKENKIQSNIFVLAIIALTLSKDTGVRYFNFAQLSHGRMKYSQKQLIGCLACMFLSFYDINEEEKIIDYFHRCYANYLNGLNHSKTPQFNIIVSNFFELLKKRNFSLWDIMISCLNYEIGKNDDYEFGVVPINYPSSKIYCTLSDNNTSEISLNIIYQTKVVSDKKLAELIGDFYHMLDMIVNNSDKNINYLFNN